MNLRKGLLSVWPCIKEAEKVVPTPSVVPAANEYPTAAEHSLLEN